MASTLPAIDSARSVRARWLALHLLSYRVVLQQCEHVVSDVKRAMACSKSSMQLSRVALHFAAAWARVTAERRAGSWPEQANVAVMSRALEHVLLLCRTDVSSGGPVC